MKKIINSWLGAASILVLFVMAAGCLGSCGNNNSTAVTPDLKIAHIIFRAHDSSGGPGNGTGGSPKIITKLHLVVSCPNRECSLLEPGPISSGGGGDSANYVFDAKTTGAIPANTDLRVEILVVNPSIGSRADSAVKK